MASPIEREMHLSRIQEMLKKGNQVWKQPDFPNEHRPDVDTISANIKIGPVKQIVLPVHPQVERARPGTRRNIITDAARDSDMFEMIYDPDTRRIVISDTMAGRRDALLRKMVFFAVGCDVSQQTEIIPSTAYTDDDRTKVKEVVNVVFAKAKRPHITRTSIRRTGFHHMVRVDNLMVGSVSSPIEIDANGIYPEMHAAVSDQILRRDGSVSSFDRAARLGFVRQVDIEEYPQFLDTFFHSLKRIDWRDLLTAFKARTLREANDRIRESVGNQRVGDEITANLVSSFIGSKMSIDQLFEAEKSERTRKN